MPTLDISSILTAVNNQQYSSQTIADTIISDTNQVQEVGKAKIASITQQADAEIIKSSAEEAGKLRAQQNSRNAATAFGTNMDIASSVITALGSQMIDSFNSANAALDNIHSKQSVGFFDNPLEYISNQLDLPAAKKEYNYHAQKFNLAETALAELNASTQSTVVTQNAIAEVKNAATLQASTDIIKAKSAQLSSEVTQQNLLYNIQGLKVIQDLNQQQVDLVFKAQGALVTQENLDISRAHLAETRRMHDLQLEERKERIDKNAADKAEIAELGDTINMGRQSLGLAPIPHGRAIQLMKMGGDTGNQIKYQYSIGAMQASVGKPIIAEEPAMAAKVVSETQAPLSPTMASVKKLLTTTYSEVMSGSFKKDLDTKDTIKVLGVTNKVLKGRIDAMAANIKFGDNNNIYAAPDLVSVSKRKSVQESVLYQKVLQPAIEAGNLNESNPDLLLALATNAAKKGIISFPDAVQGIANYYKEATIMNNVNKDYTRVGITPQTTYITEIQDPTGFTTKYDLSDPTKVSNLISKKLTAYRLGISTTSPGVMDFSSLYQ